MKNIRLYLGISMMVIALNACGLRDIARSEAADVIRRSGDLKSRVITESDLVGMPTIVRKYLRYSGVIGKEIPKFVRLKYRGLFKTDPKQEWTPFEAEEYVSLVTGDRIWYGKFTQQPFDGKDIFINGKGNLTIRVMGLFNVVNLSGKEADISEMIVYVNDMMLYPSAFVNTNIRWQTLSSNSVRATITVNGITASLDLYFKDSGELTNMISYERYATIGTNLVQAPWCTPIVRTESKFGMMLPVEGGALWKLMEGDYEYIRFQELTALDINIGELFPN